MLSEFTNRSHLTVQDVCPNGGAWFNVNNVNVTSLVTVLKPAGSCSLTYIADPLGVASP